MGKPSLKDKPKTPFTEAFLQEVARHSRHEELSFPNVLESVLLFCYDSRMMDIAVGHSTLSDVEFKGYHFPKGTQVPNKLMKIGIAGYTYNRSN